MRLFYRRPLAFAAVLYALCSICLLEAGKVLHSVFLGAVLVSVLILAFVCIVKRKIRKTGIVCFLCLGAILISAASSFWYFKVRFPKAQSYVNQSVSVRGVVEERLESGAFYSRFHIRVQEIDGTPHDFLALLECEYPSSLQLGDSFLITATPREFTRNDLFDEQSSCLADGCMLAMTSDSSDDCTHIPQESTDFWAWMRKWNVVYSYDHYQTVGQEGGGLSTALLLGNRDYLSATDEASFRYAGVSHLLALSGLHVSILVGFLDFLLTRLRLSKLYRAILIPLAAVGYLFLTGCSVSAIRAVLMVCILYFAFLWRGEYDPFTALSVALVLILFLMPYSVLDVSLWLSFAAAGGIIVFVPFVNRHLEKWKENTRLPKFAVKGISAFALAISVGVIANIALLPISAAVFGEISLWSIPATLLLSLPITLMLIFSLIVFLCPVVPFLPELCNWLGEWILSTVRSFGGVSGAMVPLQNEWCTVLLALLSVTLILLAVLHVKRARWMLTPLVLCVAIVGMSYFCVYRNTTGEWQMTTIEAGHGEVRLYTKNGHAVLIHDSYGIVNSSFEIKEAASQALCTEIDSVIFCKNYNQATYFISSLSELMRVRKVYLQTPDRESDFAMIERIYEEAQRHGIAVYIGAEEQIALYESKTS